jgi:radical SAM/Cys-rich protein
MKLLNWISFPSSRPTAPPVAPATDEPAAGSPAPTASLPVGARTFAATLERHGLPQLARAQVTTLQVNVGKLCNMACHHCHVEAGPRRPEIMSERVAQRVLVLLAHNPEIRVVDITGGAPELNPSFRTLVSEARRMGKQVIDRCNLTVLLEPGLHDLPEFLASERVRIVASLPCYQRDNVEQQRGKGAFDKSLQALAQLNALGYGSDPTLELDLVYNPVGAHLPPPQAQLEARYREELQQQFGIRFNRLLALANMPIKRFAQFLHKSGQHEAYMALLVNHFNAAAVPSVMCRSLLSVGWDGRLYDCDFNQMLEIPLGGPSSDGTALALRGGASSRGTRTIWDIDSLEPLAGSAIATGRHCFGCTAGAGSSCSGALA